jgi:hypothetical protein
MEQMTKEAEENLIQEESEIDPDYEVEDSHMLLQNITTLSVDISNIN